LADEERLVEKFVTRTEYYDDQRKNDKKHHQHEMKFLELSKDNQKMLKDLEGLPATFKNLNDTLKVLGGRIERTEYNYEGLDIRVEDIESITKGKTEHNTKVWVAIIGATPLVIGAALTFAQIFFK